MEAVQTWAEVGERIAEARRAAGLSQSELAERVDLDRTKIVRIESGERRITALEIFRLADALGVPLGHLLSRPPASLVSRRSPLEDGADDATRARYRLDALLESHARNAQWLVMHGFLRPRTLDSLGPWLNTTQDPLAMARAARQAIGVPAGPLGPLAEVAEQLGLLLTVVNEAAEGASLLLDGYGVAVISGQADPGRRRWTAAHELGHHLMQDEYHSDAGVAASRGEREQLIDRFAGELLLPEEDFRDKWTTRRPDQTARQILIDLAASYRLSWSAVIAKAHQLSVIDKDEARRLKANTPVQGDFLAVLGRTPVPDLGVGTTGPGWQRAALAAWSQGAITSARTVELLYGSISEDQLPYRELEDSLP